MEELTSISMHVPSHPPARLIWGLWEACCSDRMIGLCWGQRQLQQGRCTWREIAGALKEPADLKPAPASMTLAMNGHKVLPCHICPFISFTSSYQSKFPTQNKWNRTVWWTTSKGIVFAWLIPNVKPSRCPEISVLVEDLRTCLHVWHAKWRKTANDVWYSLWTSYFHSFYYVCSWPSCQLIDVLFCPFHLFIADLLIAH
jgi:hypothetical protein